MNAKDLSYSLGLRPLSVNYYFQVEANIVDEIISINRMCTLSILLGEFTSVPSPKCSGISCPFGKCISSDLLCNGSPDCANFFDEPRNCPQPSIRCQNISSNPLDICSEYQ